MKHLIHTLLCLCLAATTGSAQYVMSISGTPFTLDLNHQDMTAAIVDYQYAIDDAKYPISFKPRKFADFSRYADGQTRTVTVPDTYRTSSGREYTITTIGRAAFAGFTNVDYIVLPSTVTAIDEYAFFRSSIKAMEVPPSVQAVGNRAFGWCQKLKSLKLPQGVQIGQKQYAESKGCKVAYYEGDADAAPLLAARPAASQQSRQPSRRNTVATTSDVDTDLPQARKANENTFAIIIANENYKQEPRVLCAMHDGEVFRDYCHVVLGLPEENINFIHDATKNEMMAAVDWVAEIAKVYKSDARVLFYYTGHGIPDDATRSAHLLPVDAVGNNPRMAYSLNDLYASLGELEVRDVTVFLDACFSGAARGDETVGGHARGVAIEAETEQAQGNMVVFSAAQGAETAWPYMEGAHGMFTYFLLKKLKDTRGQVTYGELADYISQQVSRRSIVINKKRQTPTVMPSPALDASWRRLSLMK